MWHHIIKQIHYSDCCSLVQVVFFLQNLALFPHFAHVTHLMWTAGFLHHFLLLFYWWYFNNLLLLGDDHPQSCSERDRDQNHWLVIMWLGVMYNLYLQDIAHIASWNLLKMFSSLTELLKNKLLAIQGFSVFIFFFSLYHVLHMFVKLLETCSYFAFMYILSGDWT